MPDVLPGDASRDDRVNEAIASFLDARDRGSSPDPKDYLAKYPDIARELSHFFDDQAVFAKAAEELPGGLTAALFKPASDPDQPTEAHTPAETGDGPRLRYIGDYELLAEIARGGMGVVYKARQVTLNRTVAVKMILGGCLASPDDVKRFRVEAEAAAQLDHPGIVPIYEVGEHDGHHYYSMGFVNGASLAARVAQGPLSPREAAELVRTVAEAVHYAHEKGVIHRDLKPGNVLLDEHGRPRVTDFGLAKLTESASGLTGTGQILGTPSYMPPEQAAAQVRAIGRAADVYSLGAILYCLLTGRPPFQAATPVETLLQVQQQEPVPPRTLNQDVPLDLDTIALKCLDKTPYRRYATAQELADELDRFLTGRPILARRVGRAERAWRWCKRNPVVAALSSAAVILLTATATISSVAYFREAGLRKTISDSLWAETTAKDAALATQRRERDAKIDERVAKEAAIEAGNRERDALTEERLAKEAAQRRLAQIERGNEILTSVFKDLDPRSDEKEGKPLRALLRERLEQAVHDLDGTAVGEPLVVAKLQFALGSSLLGLGDAQKASELFSKARQTFAKHLDERNEVASILSLGIAYSDLGKSIEAVPLLEDAFERRKAILGRKNRDTLVAMGSLALAYEDIGRMDDALRLLAESVTVETATLGRSHTSNWFSARTTPIQSSA